MSQADDYAKMLGWGAPAATAPATPSGISMRAETPKQVDLDRQQQSIEFWTGKGAPSHVAEGITDALQGESRLDPEAFNPEGGGQGALGVGQWRGPRQAKLRSLPDYSDFGAQLGFAYGEVTGGDPIASAHWKEILAAPDRATAKRLWSRYFERPGSPTSMADKALISDDALRHSLAQPNSQTIYGNVYDLLALLPEADEKTAGGKAKSNSLRQSVLDRAEQIQDLPSIDVQVDKNGRAKIIDYDGLHRLELLGQMGVDAVPLRLSGVPNGTVIKEIQGLRGDVRPFDFQPVPASAVPPPPRKWWEKMGSGIATGATDPVVGAAQLAGHAGMVDPAAAPYLPPEVLAEITTGQGAATFDKAVQGRETAYQGQRQAEGDTGIDYGRLVGNVLATAPLAAVPGVGAGGAAVSAAARAGAGVLGRVAAGVGAGAGVGAATGAGEGALRPVTGPGDFATEKAGQIGEGALFGAAGGAVLGAAGGGVNALRSLVGPQTLTRAAGRLLGEDAKRLTPELLAGVKTRIQAVLNRVENTHDIRLDDQLDRALGQASNRAVDLLGETEAKPIVDSVDRIIQRADRDGLIPAQSAATLWHRGSRLDNLTESRNPDIASLAHDVQDAMRGALNRQLPPGEAAAYSAARSQWRDYRIVSDSLRLGESRLDPRLFVGQVGRRFPEHASRPGGPPVLELGRATAETWPPRNESIGGAVVNHLARHALGGTFGFAAGGPLGAAAGGVAMPMALNALARLRVASPNALRALRPPPTVPPQAQNALLALARAAAQRAPVVATPPLSHEFGR